MSHVRKQIRDNIVTTVTGLATTGSNVYQSRVYPISAGSLPALTVYTKSESSEYLTLAYPRSVERTMTIAVQAYCQGATGYDNTLDQIAVEIEEAIAADVTRGNIAKDTRVVEFDSDYSGDPDQPVASATITIEVDYVTLENDSETAR